MSMNEMEAKIIELQELDKLAQEAKEAADTSNRFDSTAFKKFAPDVYKTFTRQTTSRRFSIS